MSTPVLTGPTLDARYGHTPGKRRRDRLIAIVAGIIGAVVIVAWVVWAGLDQASGGLDTEDTGHHIIDNRSVDVAWQVSMPLGSTASCALQAQNEDHGIVGWKIVKIPASNTLTTYHTTVVRTVEQAVTGLIYRCWLT